jgi:hypothetical protein
MLSQLSRLLDTFDCQTLSDPTTAANALSGLQTAAPQCAALQASCPGLIDVDDSPGGGSGGSGGSGGTGGSDEPVELCDDTCYSPNDGDCDDGGSGSDYDICELGTDCSDCGPR